MDPDVPPGEPNNKDIDNYNQVGNDDDDNNRHYKHGNKGEYYEKELGQIQGREHTRGKTEKEQRETITDTRDKTMEKKPKQRKKEKMTTTRVEYFERNGRKGFMYWYGMVDSGI